MENKEFVYAGFIKICWAEDFKTVKLIDNNKEIDLFKKCRGVVDLFEQEIAVSYFTSYDKRTEKEIQESFIINLFGGVVLEQNTEQYNYSTITYGTRFDTKFMIGGHDMMKEMEDNEGKWCVFKISIK